MRGPIVECVPNLSDGRHSAVVDACAAAVAAVPDVRLLDRTSDVDHHRSVLTFVGPPTGVATAARRLATEVVARVDLRHHQGVHPRIGALDVVPFVPVSDVSMTDCVRLAEDFGAWLADRYRMPVYLYARAARRPDRVRLADIRRPGFEGLAAALAARDGAPDLGPARPHPTAGATVTGARPFLIAWNIQLASRDLALARSIARRIRERDGGLPAVQALGLELPALGCVQVSMNLLDATVTPLWRVLEAVRALASADGVAIRDAELIGLVPLAALRDVADHAAIDEALSVTARAQAALEWLGVRDARPAMALELRAGLVT
ncbi:MAG: glutamate formimidoyltransferase [Chloroflexi bacterium]|nr:glutamate formimidoyltransferase [Chloroflexota bacterium]